MRETTKKQLDLQEVLFSKMVVRSEFVVQKHLQHAVQAAAADLQKANISVAEATALLDYDYDKLEVMPSHSLLYKVDKYDKVSWGTDAACSGTVLNHIGRESCLCIAAVVVVGSECPEDAFDLCLYDMYIWGRFACWKASQQAVTCCCIVGNNRLRVHCTTRMQCSRCLWQCSMTLKVGTGTAAQVKASYAHVTAAVPVKAKPNVYSQA